jgi:hypothetical protein
MTKGGVGPLQPKKHIPPKWIYQIYKIWSIDMEPPKPNSLEKQMGQSFINKRHIPPKEIGSRA